MQPSLSQSHILPNKTNISCLNDMKSKSNETITNKTQIHIKKNRPKILQWHTKKKKKLETHKQPKLNTMQINIRIYLMFNLEMKKCGIHVKR